MPEPITVGERLAVMETEVKNLGQAVETGFVRVGRDIKTLSDKFDSLDKKYATKESLEATEEVFDRRLKPVEKVVYSIVGAAGLAIVGALLSLVIK